MKTLLLAVFALSTCIGLAQTPEKTKLSEALTKKMVANDHTDAKKRTEIELKKLATTLDLDKSQKSKVETVLLNYFENNDKAKQEKDSRASRKNAIDKLNQKLEEILTPAQFTKYKQNAKRSVKE